MQNQLDEMGPIDLYCHYGLSECHDNKTRDMSSCLGCWVIEPPRFIKNRNELEEFLQRWGVPYTLDTDTVHIAEEDLPRRYNDFLFFIWRLGFKREVHSIQKAS